MADLDVCAHLVRIAHAFRGREDTRYYLKGVRIEPHPETGVFIVATCGTNMLVLHDGTGRTTRPVTVHLRKLVRKSFPSRGVYRLVMALPDVADGDLQAIHPASIVHGTNEDRAVTVAVEPDAEVLGFYPIWREIVPKVEKVPAENPSASLCSAVAGGNLQRFGKAAVQLATLHHGLPVAKSTALRLRSGGKEGDPTFVHFDENLRAFGAVAALNVANATTPPPLPTWIDPASAPEPAAEAAS